MHLAQLEVTRLWAASSRLAVGPELKGSTVALAAVAAAAVDHLAVLVVLVELVRQRKVTLVEPPLQPHKRVVVVVLAVLD